MLAQHRGQLHGREGRAAQGLDAQLVAVRLGRPDRAGGVRLGVGAQPDRRGLALGGFGRRLCLAFRDAHLLFTADHLRLHVGDGGLALEVLPAHLRLPLGVVSAAQLLGDLAIGLGLHQLARRHDVADERVDAFDVIRLDGVLDAVEGLPLPLAARRQELQHRHLLGRVAEVVGHGRLQHVVDQVLHRAHPGDHPGGVLHADVDDLGDIQGEGEAVPRAHGDGREALIVAVRLGPRGPVEDDVGRRHELDLHHPHVERVLARLDLVPPAPGSGRERKREHRNPPLRPPVSASGVPPRRRFGLPRVA